MATEVAHYNIIDLIQIGSIYQYLVQNCHRDDISVIVQTTLNGKKFRQVTVNSLAKVNRVYNYLLNNWTRGKLRIRIVEQESVARM